MYKLFLCLRYLRSRLIAYFAIAGVALCVAMMVIVVSVMNGFLDKIEEAAKGLFGDVVVESSSLSGIARYDEFSRLVEREVPEVEAASPFILTYGILRIPGYDYRKTVQIAGVRLPERAEVSDFEEGLFVQEGDAAPSWDPPVDKMLAAVRADAEHIRDLLAEIVRQDDPQSAELVVRIEDALSFHRQAEAYLLRAQPHQDELRRLGERLDSLRGPGASLAEIEEVELAVETARVESGFTVPANRIILGLGIGGLSFRTPDGETVRKILPGHKVELVMLPLGRKLAVTDVSPNQRVFTVIDDCRTDVASIDSEIVYIPFETLQLLNNMGAEYAADGSGEVVEPARCSQIHVKARNAGAGERELTAIREKVERVWQRFVAEHPDAARSPVDVYTWRQRQSAVVGPIEKQRTLAVIMFAVVSLVAVVLIFVIFYMIVVQKTKDIGVLKAVGASSGGVAGIFLRYGAAVGLVGSILGAVGGYYFVRYINPIQDFVDRAWGFRVWDRDVFMFERIPNEVDPLTVVYIVVAAVAAGLLGALLPAATAARMQPVEALRYE